MRAQVTPACPCITGSQAITFLAGRANSQSVVLSDAGSSGLSMHPQECRLPFMQAGASALGVLDCRSLLTLLLHWTSPQRPLYLLQRTLCRAGLALAKLCIQSLLSHLLTACSLRCCCRSTGFAYMWSAQRAQWL